MFTYIYIYIYIYIHIYIYICITIIHLINSFIPTVSSPDLRLQWLSRWPAICVCLHCHRMRCRGPICSTVSSVLQGVSKALWNHGFFSWGYMENHRNIWKIHGNYGKILENYGKILENYGNIWKIMEIYGKLWKYMENYGKLWTYMEI